MAKSRAKMANMATKMASQNQQNSKEIAQGGQHDRGVPPKNDPPMWLAGGRMAAKRGQNLRRLGSVWLRPSCAVAILMRPMHKAR